MAVLLIKLKKGTNMRKVAIGKVQVSGLCIGGNPFSGFSHQSPERSQEMTDYFTPERIKETLRAAENAGINTLFARADDYIISVMRDYWDNGGTIQWFAQVCEEKDKADSWKKWIQRSLESGATAIYIHGGETDFWHANGLLDNLREAFRMIRDGGVPVGFAGHRPESHEWVRDNLDVDFQMCSHYNPTDRSQNPHHISVDEKWNEDDRKRMLKTIATIEKPVVHYKVFAGGNKPIIPAFEVLGNAMRNNDIVCVGMFLKDDPDMIRKDAALFEKYVDKLKTQGK